MAIQFTPAKREKVNLSLILAGPAGSGKTWTALELAKFLSEKKTAFIDTEGGSAELYADAFAFDIHVTAKHDPRYLAQAIRDAASAGYDVVVLDSLSHAWEWCLQEVDRLNSGGGDKNKFTSWAKINPIWAELMALIQAPPCHLLITARSKMGYEIVPDERTGKTKPVRIGLQPILREQTEYEPQIFATMDNSGGEPVLSIQKTRFAALTNQTFAYPGKDLAELLKTWAETGVARQSAPATFAKPLSPQERFVALQDWLANKAGNMPASLPLEDGLDDTWNEFRAVCKENEVEAESFFAALFPEVNPTDVSNGIYYALSEWARLPADKTHGHIANWQRLANGVISQ